MVDTAAGRLVLAGEFPAATQQQWRALVDSVLKGRPFDKVLVSQLYDGFSLQPLYTALDVETTDTRLGLPGAAPFLRGAVAAREAWDVRQHHHVVDAITANDAVLTDLECGATSIWLRCEPAQLDSVLASVHLDMAAVVLDPGPDITASAEALIALWRERGVAPSAALGGFGADPLGAGGDLGQAVELAQRAAAHFLNVRALVVDATPYHDAGASDAEELGCSLATAVAYLRALTAAGLDVGAACAQLEFRYAATVDQFATIAKFRAARRLWARVTEACGAPLPQTQHAVTSMAMMTQRDPWVNMLRTTVACFGAAIGGADAITAHPFDAAIGQSDAFARRIARNTQALLIDEANIARVADPAGGSWYVEHHTDALARAAWSWFQAIEAAGGMAQALAEGVIARRIDATWSARFDDIARRRHPITGVSEFPDIAEQRVTRPAAPASRARVLPLRRHASAYEALRDRADAASPRPQMFLANLGPIAVHTARATFAKNFFEAAGIATIGNDGFDSPVAAAGAFAASGARLACICSSDAVYDERAEATALALHEVGAVRVYLAGRRDTPAVDEHVFAGCDALEVLARALDAVGA